MEISVNMTAEDFMEFMEWKKNKNVYENKIRSVAKDVENLASMVLKTLVERGEGEEPEYEIESQAAANALVKKAAEFF